MNNQCYWPLTRCPKCNEQYCEKCGTHTCKQKTDRQLFVSLMRKPEMRVLLQCFVHLKMDKGLDWRDLPELEVHQDRYETLGRTLWIVDTAMFRMTTWDYEDLSYEHINFAWNHENSWKCKCPDCEVIKNLKYIKDFPWDRVSDGLISEVAEVLRRNGFNS